MSRLPSTFQLDVPQTHLVRSALAYLTELARGSNRKRAAEALAKLARSLPIIAEINQRATGPALDLRTKDEVRLVLDLITAYPGTRAEPFAPIAAGLVPQLEQLLELELPAHLPPVAPTLLAAGGSDPLVLLKQVAVAVAAVAGAVEALRPCAPVAVDYPTNGAFLQAAGQHDERHAALCRLLEDLQHLHAQILDQIPPWLGTAAVPPVLVLDPAETYFLRTACVYYLDVEEDSAAHFPNAEACAAAAAAGTMAARAAAGDLVLRTREEVLFAMAVLSDYPLRGQSPLALELLQKLNGAMLRSTQHGAGADAETPAN